MPGRRYPPMDRAATLSLTTRVLDPTSLDTRYIESTVEHEIWCKWLNPRAEDVSDADRGGVRVDSIFIIDYREDLEGVDRITLTEHGNGVVWRVLGVEYPDLQRTVRLRCFRFGSLTPPRGTP